MPNPLELILGSGLAERVLQDFLTASQRMQDVANTLRKTGLHPYDVYEFGLNDGEQKVLTFNANTFLILSGNGLEISFNDEEKWFTWDADDLIDDFPFYKVTIRNTTGFAINGIKVLLMFRNKI